MKGVIEMTKKDLNQYIDKHIKVIFNNGKEESGVLERFRYSLISTHIYFGYHLWNFEKYRIFRFKAKAVKEVIEC